MPLHPPGAVQRLRRSPMRPAPRQAAALASSPHLRTGGSGCYMPQPKHVTAASSGACTRFDLQSGVNWQSNITKLAALHVKHLSAYQ